MGLALKAAKKAFDLGEVPVGSVLINQQGQILACGYNRCLIDYDISAHAEIVTLRRAGQRQMRPYFPDCVMVVTLEPCAMCAAALVRARLSGVA